MIPWVKVYAPKAGELSVDIEGLRAIADFVGGEMIAYLLLPQRYFRHGVIIAQP